MLCSLAPPVCDLPSHNLLPAHHLSATGRNGHPCLSPLQPGSTQLGGGQLQWQGLPSLCISTPPPAPCLIPGGGQARDNAPPSIVQTPFGEVEVVGSVPPLPTSLHLRGRELARGQGWGDQILAKPGWRSEGMPPHWGLLPLATVQTPPPTHLPTSERQGAG